MMKKTKKSNRNNQLSNLQHLCMCTAMLNNTIKIIAPQLFKKEDILSMDEHLAEIMKVLIAKGEELNI